MFDLLVSSDWLAGAFHTFTCFYLAITATVSHCEWYVRGSVSLLFLVTRYSDLRLSLPVLTLSSLWGCHVCDRCLAVSACCTSSPSILTCTSVTWRLPRVCVTSLSHHTSSLRRPSTVVQVDWCVSTPPDRWDTCWTGEILYHHCYFHIRPVKIWGDGGGRHWLVRMEWRPARWSVCLPLLIFPCTIKFRSSLLAPAHPSSPGKRTVKWLWCGGCYHWFAFSALMPLVGHPACKNWVVGYWHGYLSRARCKWFAYGPADAIATPSSLAPVKSRMVYLSDAGLPRLSWKKGR